MCPLMDGRFINPTGLTVYALTLAADTKKVEVRYESTFKAFESQQLIFTKSPKLDGLELFCYVKCASLPVN